MSCNSNASLSQLLEIEVEELLRQQTQTSRAAGSGDAMAAAAAADTTQHAPMASALPSATPGGQDVDVDTAATLEAAFTGRKLFPHVEESNDAFKRAIQDTDDAMAKLVSTSKRFKRNPREGVRWESRRVDKMIAVKCPTWGSDMRRLGVAALTVFNRRFSDFANNEFVTLMWLSLGHTRVISVDGRLRYFDTHRGTWRVYTGLFPEGLYADFRTFMLRLEGFFRLLGANTRREGEAILTQLQSMHSSSPGASASEKDEAFFARCENAALWNYGARAGGADGSDEEQEGGGGARVSHWPGDTASSLSKFSKKLIYELMSGGSVVKNFTEWCSTSVTPARGVVYQDRAVRYDSNGQPLEVTDQMPVAADMFFFGMDSSLIPSANDGSDTEEEGVEMSLGDPCLLAATEDVNKFLTSTFWANFTGLEASRAALALAKRGENVPPCFIFYGAGGCGLSLFTDLLATSLGEDMHKFFDPFVFHDDEELRKTVELLAGGCVFSGQERPQGSKKGVLLHLWKKFLSGEGLRGRLPYGVLTRMIRLFGWVRKRAS